MLSLLSLKGGNEFTQKNFLIPSSSKLRNQRRIQDPVKHLR